MQSLTLLFHRDESPENLPVNTEELSRYWKCDACCRGDHLKCEDVRRTPGVMNSLFDLCNCDLGCSATKRAMKTQARPARPGVDCVCGHDRNHHQVIGGTYCLECSCREFVK